MGIAAMRLAARSLFSFVTSSGGGGSLWAPAFLFFRRGERMHRTNRVLNQAFAGLFLGLLLSGLPMATAPAQAPRAATGSGPALIIPINGTQAIQMSTKKKIK